MRGQLFLVSVSFLATSLYRLFDSDQSYRRPDIITIFAILLFGIIRICYGINPMFGPLSSPLANSVSVIFLFLSIGFYYYTAVLALERPKSVEQSLQVSSNDLDVRLQARRAHIVEDGGKNGAE